MTSVLPTDLTAQALDAALDGFRASVGAEHVLTDEEQLREFRDPYWFAGWDDYEASAVVQPESVEELQAIVRIANEHGVPLWVSSQGRNNGYGGSSPRVRGAVVVNLRRMNRVLEIDGDAAYAVVEPGVSFFELYEAVRGVGPQAVDLGAGPRLGERDRQRPRVRRRLHALRRARGQRVRPGGGAPERRAGADGHRARSRTAVPGTSTSAASGPRSTASSSSRTSASSRRWASG